MHGRPRYLDHAHHKDDHAKALQIQSCLSEVLRSHREQDYSKESLQQSAKLLEINPEVSTAWNYRKLAVTHLLESQQDETSRKAILDEELQVVEKALRRNVKSYGAWYHRKWVIQFGLSSLEHEYQLLDYLLNSDARNFHGWNYRRFLAKFNNTSEDQELDYTIKKINQNFSNYSAWHNRSALLSRKSMENIIDKSKWQQILTEEYDLVKQAFFTEPEDQSGWFYLTWLLGQTLKPSGPFLTGFWPTDGSLVTLNLSPSTNSSFWQYKAPYSKVCIDSSHLHIVLCFNKPVSGVDSASISLNPSSDVHGSKLLDVSWTPLRGSKRCSRVWFTKFQASRACFVVGTLYTLCLDIGNTVGIITEDGLTFSPRKLSFKIEVQNVTGDCLQENSKHGPGVLWPEDRPEGLSRFEESEGTLADGFQPDDNIELRTQDNWQLKTLEAQVDTFRELLDLEQDSKWAMLILARFLMTHDNLSSPVHAESLHREEVRQLYCKLVAIDPMHSHFYEEQLSHLLFDQIISSPLKLSEHWWKVERSDGYHEGWFRLNNLSLSKLGSFDKLIWVQRLDLSNNKLQSLEGIEVLQLLVSLDASKNHLCQITSLWPLQYVPSLKELNIKFNQIGSHSVDTKRYLISSCLNNSNEKGQHQWNHSSLWEVLEVFKGLALRQLEVNGNPITQDDRWRDGIIQTLPSLVWLDGIRVSS